MIEKRLDNSRQWLPPTGPKTTREEFEWTILNDRIFANEASIRTMEQQIARCRAQISADRERLQHLSEKDE